MPNSVKLAAVFLVLLGLPGCSDTPEIPEALKHASFSEQADALMPTLLADFGIEGAALAVMEGGEIKLLKGYGLADTKNSRAMTADHLFNVASVSKAVTAWGVMGLVDQGKIDLDAPVNTYLTSWLVKDGARRADEVTIRKLLSHTAGIGMPSTPGFRWPLEAPSLVEVLDGEYNYSTYAKPGTGAEIVYPPGQGFRYSGGGFLILQVMIEDVTGMSFRDYMKQQVFEPLGMNDSQFGWDEGIVSRMAVPYLKSGEEEDIFRLPVYAASSLHAPVRDMARWMLASSHTNRDLRSRVLSEESFKLMITPVASTGFDEDELPEMGLGYFLEKNGPALAISHSGDNAGWRARVLLAPETGDGFLILVNSDDGGGLVAALSCLWAEGRENLRISKGC